MSCANSPWIIGYVFLKLDIDFPCRSRGIKITS